MPNKTCCAPGCSSDSRKDVSKNPDMIGVTFHPIPGQKKKAHLRKLYLQHIRREKDFQPGKSTYICSKHFIGRAGPTDKHPVPTLFAYNNYEDRSVCSLPKPTRRKRVKTAPLVVETEPVQANIEVKTEENKTDADFSASCATEPPVYVRTLHDHNYCLHEDQHQNITADIGCQTELSGQDITNLEKDSVSQANKTKLLREIFVDKVLKDDASVNRYTGVPSLFFFMSILAILTKAGEMFVWGSSKKTDETNTEKKRRKRISKLTLKEQLVLTLVKLRLGLHSHILADIFGISVSTVTNIFYTIISAMFHLFPLKWPSKKTIKKFMPKRFKLKFPRTRCIIDCTEFHIQKSHRSSKVQATTYSTYKSANTVKLLVAVSPTGAFTFLSTLWGGNVSDRHITEHSGFLDLIEENDDVMADRGFTIRDLLLLRNATLNIPPFTRRCAWGKNKILNRSEIQHTRNIANLRIFVECAIGRLKKFRLLQNTIPLHLQGISEKMIHVAAFLCNLQKPLVS